MHPVANGGTELYHPNNNLTMYSEEEFVALEHVKAEFADRVAGRPQLTIQDTFEIRQYAKSRTDLGSGNLTAEQAAWKALFTGLTEQLRETAPEVMAEVEPLERKADDLHSLQTAMLEKLKAHPHDYGFKVPCGFLIIGALLGWFRDPSVWSMMVCGIVSLIAGFLFSIFLANSATVQSAVAIRLNQIGLERIAQWLYKRALTIR